MFWPSREGAHMKYTDDDDDDDCYWNANVNI